MSWKQYVTLLHFEARNAEPLHVGTQDGEVLLEEESGYAMIPGTSLGGALRAYLKQNEALSDGAWLSLFGSNKSDEKNQSDLYIHDLISEEAPLWEERPGVRINGVTGTVADKLERLYIAAGARFKGRIVWTAASEKQNQAYTAKIKKCLASLNQGIVRLGAFKNTGSGRLFIKEVYSRTYNLHCLDDYFDFLQEDREETIKLKQWKKWDIGEAEVSENGYKYTIRVKLVSPLLIRGQELSKAGEPDAVPIRTADDKLYIPGTSWKGALRHQFRRIVRYYGRPELEEQAFGSNAGQSGSENQMTDGLKAGIVQVADVLIEEDQELNRQWADYYGIHIDKFTGGVMSGALKQERTVRGEAVLELYLQPDKQEKDYEAIAGSLLLAMRDLAEQGFSLGSGFANGRGYLSGKDLQVISPEGNIIIHFNNRQVENEGLANRWICALKGVN